MSAEVNKNRLPKPGNVDNLIALGAGIFTVLGLFSVPWLKATFGIGLMAVIGFLVAMGIVVSAVLIRMNADTRSLYTFFALFSLAIIFLFTGAFNSDSGLHSGSQFDYVVGEVFLDQNQNGVRDGSDEPILGVELALRDSSFATQFRTSDARGLVKFQIPKGHAKIQIVVCGIAQTHTLTNSEKISHPETSIPGDDIEIYKVDIGIELASVNISSCLNK